MIETHPSSQIIYDTTDHFYILKKKRKKKILPYLFSVRISNFVKFYERFAASKLKVQGKVITSCMYLFLLKAHKKVTEHCQ